MNYIGRFAPSPTGPLHEGSLLTALASYLDAKHQGGQWLVRIEDLDTPRCHTKHEASILNLLERYGFEWDGPLTRQSERIDLYKEVYQQLLESHQAYWCQCSRSELKRRDAINHYDRHCLKHPQPKSPAALRLKVEQCEPFNDQLLGHQDCSLSNMSDFILYRRDHIVAYQLAVVVDDHLQGVNHVVRGRDLLLETHKQRALQLMLNYPLVNYAHLPLVLAPDGQKLSKQTFAEPLKDDEPSIAANLHQALYRLGQLDPGTVISHSPREILGFAAAHWDITKIPKKI